MANSTMTNCWPRFSMAVEALSPRGHEREFYGIMRFDETHEQSCRQTIEFAYNLRRERRDGVRSPD
jgi:hypothetical protein